MSKLKVYNQKGEVVKEIETPKVFNLKINQDLISRYVKYLQTKNRESIANTKDRSQVSGGGRKPWKQKGTGNARAGSSRSPIWVGGGVTFGPTNEKSYAIRMNTKERQKAIVMVLAEKLKNSVVVDKIELTNIKTKKAVELLNKLPLEIESIIFLTTEIKENIYFSFRNLPFLSFGKSDNLNLLEIIKAKQLLIDETALNQIAKTYANVE